MDGLAYFPTTRRVPTRTGRLVVHDSAGPGRPLLLWPSLFTDHTLYDAVRRCLGAGWRTLAVEAPGFGDSDPLPPAAGSLFPASGLPELLDALDIERVTLVGTSWGGQVVAAFAAAHPDRVDGLLLANTPLRFGYGNHFLALALARLSRGEAAFADALARAMLGNSTRDHAPDLVRTFTDRLGRFRPRDAVRTAQAVIGPSSGLERVASKIACPTTLLFGDEDRACPALSASAWAERLPTARIRVLKACGALAPLEAPAQVAAELATIG